MMSLFIELTADDVASNLYIRTRYSIWRIFHTSPVSLTQYDAAATLAISVPLDAAEQIRRLRKIRRELCEVLLKLRS